MKSLKTLAAMAIIALAAPTVSAQFSNSGASGNRPGASRTMSAFQPGDYNRFQISYDNTTFTGHKAYDDYFIDGNSTLGTNGLGVSFIHGFNISKTLPMYIETGLKFTALFNKSTSSDDENIVGLEFYQKYQYMHLSLPVNFSYKFNINDNFTINPYIGLNFKVNVLGRFISEYNYDGDNSYVEDYVNEYNKEAEWINVFSDDDETGMGGKDYTWNRFQLGWHIGVGVDIKKFYVGVQYGTDFIPANKYKKNTISSGNLAVNLGINF